MAPSMLKKQRVIALMETVWPAKLKYLLSDPLHKMFANLYFTALGWLQNFLKLHLTLNFGIYISDLSIQES